MRISTTLSPLALILAAPIASSAGHDPRSHAHALSPRQAPAPVDPSTVPWWQNDPDQLYHARFHCWLSMAAYGDYNTLCPQTAFAGAGNWTPIGDFSTPSGLEGYQVIVPTMDKVVIVFKGVYGWENFDHTPASLAPLNIGNCDGCTAHSVALQMYLEARNATNDWADAKAAVVSTGHKFSVTGHAFGGAVAQIAALDLGYRGLVHYSHNQGAPRVFNPAAASAYNKLFEGESGQRVVANEDSVPTVIPFSENYTFTNTGIHIWDYNNTYGMQFENCWYNSENATCAGGGALEDNYYYFTQLGTCGWVDVPPHQAVGNVTLADQAVSSMSVAYVATATTTPHASSTAAAPTSSSAFSGSAASPSSSGGPERSGSGSGSTSSNRASNGATGNAKVSMQVVPLGAALLVSVVAGAL